MGGRPHHVVGLSTGTLEIELFVDAETKLISQISFETDMPQIGTVKITGGFSEYEEYDGAMLATHTSLEIPGFPTIDTRLTTTEINVEVDHSIFEKP